MHIKSIDIEIKGKTLCLSPDTTRSDMIKILGEPDDIGGISRKAKRGRIIKYGDIEYHFDGHTDNSNLCLIYSEREYDGEWTPDIAIKFTELDKK